MARTITFRDEADFQFAEVPAAVTDYYSNAFAAGGPVRPLRVRIAASHSGKITRNNGFYLPSEMKTGTLSWTAQFNKPILVHHDDYQDPIGRVVAARYVDLSGNMRGGQDSVKDAVKAPLSDVLGPFVEGTLPADQLVNIARDYFINDTTVSDDPDYMGLGYTEIIADITDPDSIQKVIDKRYLTGSIGASTDKAVCSICKKDWAAEEACDHRPGKMYDGRKAVLIAGRLNYEEYSFVNKPADRHSGVIEIVTDGVKDSVQIDALETGDRLTDNVSLISCSISDSVEDSGNLPTLEELSVLIKAVRGDLEDEKVTELATSLLSSPEFKTLVETNTVAADTVAKLLPEDKKEEPVPPQDEQQEPVQTDPLVDFWGADLEDLVGDDPWGRDYAEMMMVAIQEEKDETKALELRNAKLSSTQRKNMAGSTFCGPNRSFPVPDCAHVTAARRLINRYKGPGDKSKILACVARKASRLGCGSEKDSLGVGDYTVEYFDMHEDNDLIQLFNGLSLTLLERNLMDKVDSCAKKVVDTQETVEQNTELTNKLAVTQSELKAAHDDLQALHDQYKAQIDKYRSTLTSQLMAICSLKETVNETAFLASLSDKSLEDLEKLVSAGVAAVDYTSIRNKLVPGATNTEIVVQQVEDPTLHQQQAKPGNKETAQIQALSGQIKQRYLDLLRRDRKAADRFLASALTALDAQKK